MAKPKHIYMTLKEFRAKITVGQLFTGATLAQVHNTQGRNHTIYFVTDHPLGPNRPFVRKEPKHGQKELNK